LNQTELEDIEYVPEIGDAGLVLGKTFTKIEN